MDCSCAESKTKKKTDPKDSVEIVRLISEKFPKFSKIQLCMLRNPEYGVRLVPEAERLLREKGKRITTATLPQKKKRVAEKKRVSVRLSDADYEKVKEQMQNAKCSSMQEYLEQLILNDKH